MRWALTGLGLALLILLVLPSKQIKLGASQLNGLIGSYGGGTVAPHYDVTYSGGTIVSDSPASFTPGNYSNYQGTGSASCSGASKTCTGSVKGPLTAHFTWNNGGNLTALPPAKALVSQSCSASWSSHSSGGATVTGNAYNGLDGATPISGTSGGISSGVAYTVQDKPGQSFDVSSCSPTVRFDGKTDNIYDAYVNGTVSFLYAAAATPVNISAGAFSSLVPTGWDANNPPYLSGTGCFASGGCGVTTGYVAKAELFINGTSVQKYFDASSAPNPLPVGATTGTGQTDVSLIDYFDSTQYQDASTISIKMSFSSDLSTTPIDTTIQAKAYNKIYLVGNSSGTNNFGSKAEGKMIAVFPDGGGISATPTSTDLKTSILTNLLKYTDLFDYTHGDPGDFGDCTATTGASLDLTHYILSSEVSSALAKKDQTQPPYNFVFLCACNAGTPALANAFGISGSATDQAFLGFTTDVDNTDRTVAWDINVCTSLKAGNTLFTAVRNANQNNSQVLNGQANAGWTIIGDQSMTLSGTVYGGSVGASSR